MMDCTSSQRKAQRSLQMKCAAPRSAGISPAKDCTLNQFWPLPCELTFNKEDETSRADPPLPRARARRPARAPRACAATETHISTASAPILHSTPNYRICETGNRAKKISRSCDAADHLIPITDPRGSAVGQPVPGGMARTDLLSQTVEEMHAALGYNATHSVPRTIGCDAVNDDVASCLRTSGRSGMRAEQRQTERVEQGFCLIQSVGAGVIVRHGNADGVQGIQDAAVWVAPHVLGAELHRHDAAKRSVAQACSPRVASKRRGRSVALLSAGQYVDHSAANAIHGGGRRGAAELFL
eukprot:5103985-Pyramimonas_sp.AAC.2